MTADIAPSIETARDRADRIRMGMESVASLTDDITAAYRNQDHYQLGYESWAAYVEAEFINVARMRLSRDKRRELVSTLETEADMSTRAIAAVTGVDHSTVIADQRAAGGGNTPPGKRNRSSRPVQGQDGKTYAAPPARSSPANHDNTTQHDEIEEAEIVAEETETERVTPAPATPPERKPRRAPLDKSARNAGHNMRLAANRVANVVHDDRFRQNRDQITRIMRRDLVHALETTQALLEQMPEIDPETGELVE